MSSFVRFVLKCKHDKTPLGDVARDIKDDKNLKRTWCYKTSLQYLANHGASSSVYYILEEANKNYINNKNMKMIGEVVR